MTTSGRSSADRVRDPLAQPQRRLHLAVGLVEEVHARDADLGRGGSLLALAQGGQRLDVGVGSSLPLSPRVTSR